ncbi:MAG: SDR family oxidoreductase [Candidatus Helarchaeota archaeon]
MKLKNKKILVTGGAGFIGSHIVDELLKYDNEVTVIDDLSTGRLDNLTPYNKNKNFKFIKGDISDPSLVKKVLKDIEIIFHEAALPSVQRSIKNPLKSHKVNVNGTLNLLLAARDSSVKKFIYASSSSVYGDTPTLPKREDMKPNPKSPYAITKLTCEYYLLVFYNIYGLKTTSLRYFNVFGPRQSDNQYSGVVSIFISRILKDTPPIIYGDGKQTRDFTYVANVVNANLLSAQKKESEGEIFNVGCGLKTSIIDLTEEIIKISKKEIKYIFANPRIGDVRDSLADISKISHLLDYEPKITLKEGLTKLYEWYKIKLGIKNESYQT